MSRNVYVPCTRASKFRGIVEALYDSENPCGFQVLVEGHFQQSEFPRWTGHRNGPTNRSGGVEVIVNDMLCLDYFVPWSVDAPTHYGNVRVLLDRTTTCRRSRCCSALGYSTLRMIIFFANSVRLSDATVEDKRGDDEEEPKERPSRGRRARSPSEGGFNYIQ